MTTQTTNQTTTDVNTTDVTAIVREKYGEAARRVLTGTGTASCGTSPSARPRAAAAAAIPCPPISTTPTRSAACRPTRSARRSGAATRPPSRS